MNTTPASTAPQFAIMPLRFSDQPAQMIAFLRTLGLADVVTTQGDNFAELVAGGGGRVLVHAAAGSETRAHSGTTDLCLMVDSADEAARVLIERGLDAEVWDESYGRQGALRLPGAEVERARDVGSELGPSLLVRLGLETSEDLTALAERLTAAGYEARVVEEHGLRAVHLTDPDGEHLEIHPRSDV